MNKLVKKSRFLEAPQRHTELFCGQLRLVAAIQATTKISTSSLKTFAALAHTQKQMKYIHIEEQGKTLVYISSMKLQWNLFTSKEKQIWMNLWIYFNSDPIQVPLYELL